MRKGAVCISLFCFYGVFANAEDNSPKTQAAARAQLQTIQEEVRRLEASISREQQSAKSLEQDLHSLENKIQIASSKLAGDEEKLKIAVQHHQTAMAAVKEADEQRLKQAHELTKQIETQYVLGNESYLKIILTQKKPIDIKRLIAYLNYINQARIDALEDYNHTITELNQREQEALQKKAAAESLFALADKERASLRLQLEERSQLLTALAKQLAKDELQLTEKKKEEDTLNQLMRKLESALADIPNALNQRLAFANQRGRFPWPTTGKVTHRFGSQRLGSKSVWNGIIIAAPEGQTVKTIHSGRVAYADWLRGFGLLIIIDHGDGYMTLYAHNQSLYKDIGDWVESGEIIARVGKTGGIDNPGLYFEIRQNGQPKNPLQWIQKNAVMASQ